MVMVAVKSLGGTNYVRAENVIAVQATPTGGSIVVMDTGVTVQSTELAKDVAERIEGVTHGPSADRRPPAKS